jgi:hypothetical protein
MRLLVRLVDVSEVLFRCGVDPAAAGRGRGDVVDELIVSTAAGDEAGDHLPGLITTAKFRNNRRATDLHRGAGKASLQRLLDPTQGSP